MEKTMQASDLVFSEITDLNDDILPPWLTLYETAFPPEERLLIADIMASIKNKARGVEDNNRIIAVTADNKFLGLAMWTMFAHIKTAAMWYLAIKDEFRNSGIGSAVYNRVVADMRASGAERLIFEVEVPEEQNSKEHRQIAERRIGFYRRLGARLLEGIHYMQHVGPHQPPIPCHLMFHSFNQLTPQQAFDIANNIFGELVMRTGELALK